MTDPKSTLTRIADNLGVSREELMQEWKAAESPFADRLRARWESERKREPLPPTSVDPCKQD